MTFEQFQATRQRCEDLGAVLADARWEDEPAATGFLYLGTLYIEDVAAHWPQKARDAGKYHLIIGNVEEISSDLEALERQLYAFAVSEGYTLKEGLVLEYAIWNNLNGLSLGSADEHLFDETLTQVQRDWLADFCRRWDSAEA